MRHLVPARQSLPEKDPIFALNAEATRRRQAGERIVNATLGALTNDDGSLAILPSVARTLREVPAAESAAYAPIAGQPQFLAAVIGDLFRGHDALAEGAVAASTPGGTGALRIALMNYLEHGQSALAARYFWGPYRTLCDEHERTLSTFEMFDARGGLNVDALESSGRALIERQGRLLLLLNDPCNNPTGYSMSLDEWRAVAGALERLGERAPVTLLVDMAYWMYGAAADHRAFLSALEPLLGKVGLLFAWSASKTFTHYGLRVGALVACAGDEEARAATSAALAYSCRGTWSNCNRGGLFAVTRHLIEAALAAESDRERDGFKALLQRRVAAFNAAAASHHLRIPRYEGGFFVTVFHDQAEEKAAAMREEGVFVVPQKGALRVALCSTAEADIPKLVDALADE